MPKSAQSLSELAKKINNFLEYLEVEKGASLLTIRNYKHYLGRFANFVEEKGAHDTKAVTNELIHEYRTYLSRLPDAKGGTLSRKTQGYHVIAIRSFLRYLIKNGADVLSPDTLELPKISDRTIKFLSGEQVDKLLNAPTLSEIQGIRDKAILEVFFSTGIRVSELVKLNRDKVNLGSREFGIVGKGGKARVVFLSQRACDWVKKYLDAREDKFQPLFIRHKGKVDPTTADEKMRLTPRSVQRMIKKYVKKVKLPIDATPHTIRHSFATDLLMAGADLRSVQEMLGHKNVQTTQVYTHVTHRHLKDVHQAFHGKGGK
ncbi:tyrosine-type recombinase/integrase [Candidatus Woesebacteria bacterium]|nr:tyrosine-type recombinase/integrase [Candidatus Woesebacteria bacterium]